MEKGRVPEQGRVPPLGWARASRVPRMQTKTMKKGPGIGKGKTMPIQDPNAILHTFLICVEDSLQAAGNDIE